MLQKLDRFRAWLWCCLAIRWRLGSAGRRLILYRPTLLSGLRHVHIGDSVTIRPGLRLEAIEANGRTPTLTIGSHVNIEQNVHIVCHSRLTIGDNVSITANCALVDVTHPFEGEDPRKIGNRILDEDSFLEIGNGCFIGIGSVILPNVRLGAGCVVGANSVVSRSFPPRSVIAGTPARLIRQY